MSPPGKHSVPDSANGQPLNFWGFNGKIKFKLLFHGPLAE